MTLVTRNGETLTAYAWGSLEAAYRAAGLDPDACMVVVQGSHGSGGASASGSTHDRGDTADLRTRNLPASAQADLCRGLVTELRRLGWCAWYRDQAHGGMDPHIHAVYRWADPALSSGAQWQVSEYDRGRDGLSASGPDYHPRPAQAPWVPGTPDDGEEPNVLIFQTHNDGKPDGQGIGTGRHYLVLPTGAAIRLTGDYTQDGVPVVRSATEQTDRAFFAGVTQHEGGA